MAIKPSVLLVIVAICVSGAIVTGLYRAGIIGSRLDEARQAALQAATEREQFAKSRRETVEHSLKALSMRSVNTASTVDAISAVYTPLYRDAARTGASGLSRRDVDLLAQLASEFLYYRYVAASPDAYIQWMDRNDYRWIDQKRMQAYMIEPDWAHFYPDEAFPGFDSPEIVFSRFWQRQEGEDSIRVVAVSDHEASVAIVAGTAQWPKVSHPMPPDTTEMAWSGNMGTMRRWFEPRSHEFRQFAERVGTIEVATVAFVVEREGGRRDPLALFVYKGPDKRWYIRSVVAINAGQDTAIAQEM